MVAALAAAVAVAAAVVAAAIVAAVVAVVAAAAAAAAGGGKGVAAAAAASVAAGRMRWGIPTEEHNPDVTCQNRKRKQQGRTSTVNTIYYLRVGCCELGTFGQIDSSKQTQLCSSQNQTRLLTDGLEERYFERTRHVSSIEEVAYN